MQKNGNGHGRPRGNLVPMTPGRKAREAHEENAASLIGRPVMEDIRKSAADHLADLTRKTPRDPRRAVVGTDHSGCLVIRGGAIRY